MSFYSPVNFSSQALPITLTGSAANPAGTVRYIGGNASTTDLNFNVLTGGVHSFRINGTGQFQFNASGLVVSDANLASGAAKPFESRSTAAAQLRITYTAGSVYADILLNSSGQTSFSNTGFGYLYAGAGGTQCNFYPGTTAFGGLTNYSAVWQNAYAYPLVLATASGNSASSLVQIAYMDGLGGYKIALEVGQTASTYSKLKLMPAGGDVSVGGAAIATNATSGFLRIPTCAGTPTGVPANAVTGLTELVVDSSNNKLYAYYGAAWHDLTGA